LQRHLREQPQLLPLPACDFDTALVVYRHVNVEGFIAHRLNLYSVPWSHIGQVLPVRVNEQEVIVYAIDLDEIARHRLVPSTLSGIRQTHKSHHPADDPGQRTLLLRQRFGELGPSALQFLDGLLAKQTQGKLQAQQLLALVAHYRRDDVLAALQRALRFGAFSLAAIRRILAEPLAASTRRNCSSSPLIFAPSSPSSMPAAFMHSPKVNWASTKAPLSSFIP